MAIPDLVLRDIHVTPAPGWWPPAPGWWWLAAGVLLVALGLGLWRWRSVRRRRRWLRLFDAAVAAASDPPAQVAVISSLLRRAARRAQPDADRLQGEAWLRFLDGGADDGAGFTDGAGALLRDGAFRRQVSDTQVEALRSLARRRFLSLMTGSR